MAVREKLEERKLLGPGLAIALILAAILIVGYQFAGGTTNPAAASKKSFYTDDHGKTYFTDDAAKIVPFDHHGRQAYRADVFKGGADGKPFVGLVYRYTDGGKREMEQYLASKAPDPDGAVRLGIEQRGMQVKPVGADDKGWLPNDEMTADKLRRAVKTPACAPAELINP